MRDWRVILTTSCVTMLVVQAARGDDWPQFRSAHRDAISKETGLLRKWPEGGPKVLWSTEVCDGYASAAVYEGRANGDPVAD